MIHRSSIATIIMAVFGLAAVSTATAQTPTTTQTADRAALRTPAALNEEAPATYRARFETNEGDFVIEVNREWAPNGADRFYNLVKNGFYDDVRFFRVLSGFMAQFGIHGDPAIQRLWVNARIPADPVKQSNTRGMVTYAMSSAGPHTRSTQVFINYSNQNSQLDASGFAPFGRVVSGMDVVEKLYSGYGEGAPNGRGPDQGLLQSQGNAYLTKDFPNLDYIRKATIE